ncbi:uncharacterized protein E0L32_011357 [Thyridium curvatum]|uniref:Fatty acid synthase subunit alpha n=1 Tax=Thyridium curvatum TaxID=1093900 RepID=A0A507BJG1_9PEZI|nr:uncharacterized protein E0L32_011357 [Thyridium curvatum]TPX18964.1 hypothetical protein E0L32_011357 [Thyridium curvatum]
MAYTSGERELAYILLVELIAHQFCYPVRWIETQDVILAERQVERLIEIGPNSTLTNMAKRTIESKYQGSDMASGIHRQLLSTKMDTKEILYEYGPDSRDQQLEATKDSSNFREKTTANVPVLPMIAAPVSTATQQQQRGAVPSASVTVVEVVKVIIATTLKITTAKVSMTESIKDLAAGRSTLQNEMVGYLEKEFGSLPHDVENMKLGDLCSFLQPTFPGQLGQQSQSIINRMVAVKFPGTWTLRSVRKDLEAKWGLVSDRQDSVLLAAAAMQPISRFASEAETTTFIENVVSTYMENAGISPIQTVASNRVQDAALDTAVLARVREDQDALNTRVMNVYTSHLQPASDADQLLNETLTNNITSLQSQLESWVEEHGESYGDGIVSKFDAKKARSYDSSWNWGMQALLSGFYSIINNSPEIKNDDLVQRSFRIRNQCSIRMLEAMKDLKRRAQKTGQTHPDLRERCDTAVRWLETLSQMCIKDLQCVPVYYGMAHITAPKTLVDDWGDIKYFEIPRSKAPSSTSTNLIPTDGVSASQAIIESIWQHTVPYDPSPNSHIRIKKKGKHGWEVNDKLTQEFYNSLRLSVTHGISFYDKCVLITGASKTSIGLDILKGVLNGGAKVIVTTRSYSAATARFYQQLYMKNGARGSRLVFVPFNQGSKRDVDSLISYIYDTSKGLGWDLDYIVPFAAISENGRDISNIDSVSELAHRVMLTNIVRTLGEVRTQKRSRGINTRPAQVILPLSPNDGIFGNDGLYSESKLALQSLLNKWRSEDWGDHISICGASIGWTRGTGLMSSNDIVAEGIEEFGVRTFSQEEMAAHILGLMSPTMVSVCQEEPIIADLMGGMDRVEEFGATVSKIRAELMATSEIRRAIHQDKELDLQVANSRPRLNEKELVPAQIQRRMNIPLGFPKLLEYETGIAPFHETLAGMVDLERVVVVVGFSELGPQGSSRTRWEVETEGQFSLQGCIEIAWMMGLIKHHDGPIAGKGYYDGWVDAKTGVLVADEEIKTRYESHILAHTGIRLVEVNSEGSDDATKRPYLHEVHIHQDLEPFEAPRETAIHLKLHHGDKAHIAEIGDSGQFHVQIKKGATLLLPKATDIGRRVAGQVPTGWDPRTYGISEEITSQVDRLTLYNLVCTAEAFLSAGVTDPYEFYQYIHTSDIGICIGSSIGGVSSLTDMLKNRLLDKPVQSDVLQETYVNTASAWVNMLLLSANGPIKTPVGACATALEALDTGYELIVSGKAKVCVVGGLDDLQDDMSFEFANMKATIDPETDFNRGREPAEMSRPATTSRDGFVEAQGCGLQVLTSAKLALEMGLPIYGVVTLTHIAGDKIGRSVPAPGAGLLSVAREERSALPPALLDPQYRRQLRDHRLSQIKEDQEFKLALLRKQLTMDSFEMPKEAVVEYSRERISCIQSEAEVQRREALYSYGNHFWKGETRISPLRGALATWGLTIDDLDVASFHGTSTAIGDKNEIKVFQQQLCHLGRTKGVPVMGVFQKHLTGHSKGAAGAWMLNGCLQILNDGLVPGNRNADNIDEDFEGFDHITFPNRSIQTECVKAFSITSFGFGQKGAQAIGVHPRYLFATLGKESYQGYQKRVAHRIKRARAHFHGALIYNRLFVAKERPPYAPEQETAAILNPLARFT